MKYEEPKFNIIILGLADVLTSSVDLDNKDDPNGEITLPDDL